MFSYHFLVRIFVSCHLISNCPRFTYAYVHSRSRAYFRDLIATRDEVSSRVRYEGLCALLAQIESFVSHMNVHGRPHNISTQRRAFCFSIFCPRVCVHINAYACMGVYVCVCTRYARQPRITCHKLVLPSIANIDIETGVHAAFREKRLEVLPAYLMRFNAVSSTNTIS